MSWPKRRPRADRRAEARSEALHGLHHAAKAKHVIYLFMSGGPSQLDLWDYKPKLLEMFNQQLPDHVRSGQRITGMTANQKDGLAALSQQVQV